ncbi:MAG TPA: hypothetical protein VMV93_11760 [Chloroflexota bacterium]|nr:hypothetical protein [Chloroflexota bacterium]
MELSVRDVGHGGQAKWLRSCSTVKLVLYLALLSECPRDPESVAVCRRIREELRQREWAV